jgi:hypothetical protein
MTVGRSLLLFGLVCLTVMVFTHVAEGLNLFSWGLPPVSEDIVYNRV